MTKLLDHWIQHNDHHIGDYHKWANEARDNGQAEVANLLDAAGILAHEEVQIWNVTQGTRLATYALEGPRGLLRPLGVTVDAAAPDREVRDWEAERWLPASKCTGS